MFNSYFKRIVLFFLIPAAVIFLLYRLWVWSKTQVTDNAYVESDISLVSPEINGLIEKILIPENAEVKEGEVIAEIQSTDYEIEYQKAKKASEIGLSQVQAFNQKVEMENVKLEKLNTALKYAKNDLARTADLQERNFASQQALDVAQEKVTQAKLDLQATEQNLTLLGIEKQIQEKESFNLTEDEKLALRNLNNTKIRASITGRIGNSGLRVGNYIRAGSIACSIIPNKIYVKANFKETQITKLKEGMQVGLTFDYLAGKNFTGTIRSFAPATGSKFSMLPVDNATGNFTKIVQRVSVIIDIDDPDINKNIIPGMSANVSVITQ